MGDQYATSFEVLNYSGLLFNKGNTRTPLSSIIGSRAVNTNHVEFVTGQEYSGGEASQPAISEEASLTAPEATVVTREQKTNVTQIFQESVAISYGKMSNMGTLSGVNIAGQQANPINELDFQTAAKMQKMANDIEYTFINGEYQKADNDATANKTRGLVNAITSNVLDMNGKPLTLWKVAELLAAIKEGNAPTAGLALWLDMKSRFQLNADAKNNGFTIVENSRNINGINLSTLITPAGEVMLYDGMYIPAGKAMLLNLDVIRPVNQPTPGKGNFFRELLAKTGAGEKYQIFGQVGLDHGPEWYHGMFTNIDTTFTEPESGIKVYVDKAIPTVESAAALIGAELDKTTVDADDTAKVAVSALNYDVKPKESASLAYLWQVRAKTGTTWTDLTSSYTGYNTSELTVKTADAEKHYRCKVTATGTAVGTVYSNECTVNAAD